VRGPGEVATGEIRRVMISNVVVYNADAKYASIISGVPGHAIDDLRLSNIRIYYQGGGTREQAKLDPAEKETDYPEPAMFGEMPAYGFFIRHVRGLQMKDVEISTMKPDARSAFILNDVRGADFEHIRAEHAQDAATFVLKNVLDFSTHQCWPLP